jgi:hypothetical protein
MSDSLAIKTVSGNGGHSYTRALTDSIAVSGSFVPPHQKVGENSMPRMDPYSRSASQRMDERINLSKLAKKVEAISQNTVGATPFLAETIVLDPEGGKPQQLDDVEGQDAEPDDNSLLTHFAVKESTQNAALASTATSASFLAGALVVFIVRQPTIAQRGLPNTVAVLVFGDRFRLGAAPVALALVIAILFAVQPGTAGASGASVQRGSFSMTTASHDVDISAVDTSHAVVLFSIRTTDNGPDAFQVTGRLVDSTTLRFERYGTPETIVEWQVIEDSDITVQAGEESYNTGTDSVNVGISAVDLSESFIIVTNRLNTGTSSENSMGFWTGRLVDSDTISLERGRTGEDGVVSWQAVSIEGTSVQSGSFSTSGTDGTAGIASVDTGKSFLMFSTRASVSTNIRETSVRGALTDDETVTFSRTNAGSGTIFAEWFVVEWDRFSVQAGQTTVSGGSAFDEAISDVGALEKAFNWHSRDSTGTGNGFDNTSVTSSLTSTTNLQLEKGANGQTQVVEWQVVAIRANFDVQLAEGIGFADAANTPVLRQVSDSLSVTDSVQSNHVVYCSLYTCVPDSLSVADSIDFEHILSPFPQVASVTESLFSTDADTHEVAMPATVEGDLLLVLFSNDGVPEVTTPEGWTLLETATRGTNLRSSVYAKIAAGTEGGTTVNFATASNERAVAQVYQIPALRWQGDIAEGIDSVGVDFGSTDAPDPPSLSPAWGDDDNLWIVFATGSAWAAVNSYPLGYSSGVHTVTATGNAHVSASSATLYNAAASEDPGAFSMSSEENGVVFTIAVRPPVFIRLIDDALQLDDEIAYFLHASRSAGEELQLADDADANYHATRPVSDELAAEEQLASSPLFFRGATEDLGVADALAIEVGRPAGDQVAVSDEIARIMQSSRAGGDSLEITDSLATAVVRPIVESVGLQDAIATSTAKPLGDSIEVTDGISVVAVRPAEDSISVGDEIAMSVVRPVQDSVEVSDGVATGQAAQPGDSFELQDAISAGISRSVSDGLAIGEQVAGALTATGAEEQLSVTDKIATGITRSLDDSVALDDEASAAIAAKAAADSLQITDSIAAVPARTLTDTVTIADSAAVNVGRTADDAVQVQDEVKAVLSGTTMPDEVAISDSIAVDAGRQALETVSVADEIGMAVGRTIGETLQVQDAAALLVQGGVPEELSVADEVSVGLSRSLHDVLLIDDAVAKAPGWLAADAVAVDDEIAINIARAVADALGVDDAVAEGHSGARPAADAIALSDEVSAGVARAADDVLVLQDALAMRVSRAILDDVALADEVKTPIPRSAFDAVALTDELAVALIRNVPEELQIADDIYIRTARSVSDELQIEDGLAKGARAAIGDSLTVGDATAASHARRPSDTLAVQDALSAAVARGNSDTLQVGDAIALAVGRPVQDSLTLSEQVAHSATADVGDSVEIGDAVSVALARQSADAVVVSDNVAISLSRQVSDTLQVQDTLAGSNIEVTADSLAVEDEITAILVVQRAVADSMAVTDSISQPPTLGESVAISDVVSTGVFRSLADGIGLADEATAGWFVNIADAVGVDASLSEVSWNRILSLDEGLVLSTIYCAPTECNSSPGFAEEMSLQDLLDIGLVLPPRMNETVTVADSVAVGATGARQLEDAVGIADASGILVRPAPQEPLPESPLPAQGALIVDNKDAAGVPASVSVPATFDWSGNTTQLAALVMPAPQTVNATVPSSALPEMVIVLPTYHLNNTPNPQLPGDDILLSVMAASIPAESPVMVPINIAETPETLEHGNFVNWMTIEFTPAVDSTDFALVVTLVDEPAGGYPQPQGDLKPLYLDVRWMGEFGGPEDPSVEDYYDSPPEFTFSVNEDWIQGENAVTDENGVPVLELWLLNDSTGQWESVDDISLVEQVGDTYTFSATLPHFSNYAVTASKAAGTGGGGGNKDSPAQFAVGLVDALGFSESPTGRPITIIEEPVGVRYVANLLDSVTVSSRPVAYNTFEILRDLEVSIAVVDVRHDDTLFAGATAELEVLATNRDAAAQAFALDFWYNDQTVSRKYETSVQVEVGPGESIRLPVMIPFGEPGTFSVGAEAVGAQEGEVLESARLTVVVPWLEVYLYVLIAGAGAIFAVAVFAVLMAGHASVVAARHGGSTEVVKRAARSRSVGAGRYLAVNVSLANGSGGWLAPGDVVGEFLMEVVNSSAREQELVLAYHLQDAAGIGEPESLETIRLGGRKATTIQRSAVLPSKGAYVLVVEVRDLDGNVLARAGAGVKAT